MHAEPVILVPHFISHQDLSMQPRPLTFVWRFPRISMIPIELVFSQSRRSMRRKPAFTQVCAFSATSLEHFNIFSRGRCLLLRLDCFS